MDNKNIPINFEVNDIIIPANLEIMITTGCNLRCTYCFEKRKARKKIDINTLLEMLKKFPVMNEFSLFGGEPLLALDIVEEIIKFINEDKRLTEDTKQNQLRSVRYTITNSTLVPELIEKIKDCKLELQISLDGCKEAHNMCRVFADGSGSFNKIMESVKVCKENNIRYSFHGVLTNQNLPYLFETIKTFFELEKEIFEKSNSPIDEAIRVFSNNNWCQIAFEPDWLDSDIDLFIYEIHKTVDWIYNNDTLSQKQKNDFLLALVEPNRGKGGICGAGHGFMTVDHDFNLFPCHRSSQWEVENNPYKIGKIFDIDDSNKMRWNSLFRIGQEYKYMYSACIDKNQDTIIPWSNWCPMTNYETSNNVYYQSCKYNVLMFEIGRALKSIKDAYYIDIQNKDHNKDWTIDMENALKDIPENDQKELMKSFDNDNK